MAGFRDYTPEQQEQLATRTMQSFGNAKIGNVNRAKQALNDYPDFANRMAEKQGIRTATPNNSDRDDSMREFRVDDAVYKSLQNADGSMPEEAKPAPRAASGKGTGKGKASSNNIDNKTGFNRDDPREDNDAARQKAMTNAATSKGTKGAVPDGGAEAGMGNGQKAAIGGAVVGTLGYLLNKYYGGGKGATPEAPGRVADPMGAAPVEEAAPREPGRGVATRPPVLEGEIEPPARGNIDTMIESSMAEDALPPPQRALPAPPPEAAAPPVAANTDVPAAPSGPQQLRGPSRASQYPTPMDGDPQATIQDILSAIRGQPDASGVERTLARKPPKIRAPGR